MHSSLTFVAARCLRMMSRLFMLTRIVLFRCFCVVLSSVGAVF
jgi:hypothetical protein